MTEPKDLEIDMHLVQEQLDADPEMADAVREILARMRQAHEAVQRGQYATMDEAMAALGVEVSKIDPETGEEIDTGVTLHDKIFGEDA